MAPRKPHTKDLDDKARLAKNKRIAQSQKETRKRRKNMDVLVRTVKIQRNKLSSSQRENLIACSWRESGYITQLLLIIVLTRSSEEISVTPRR